MTFIAEAAFFHCLAQEERQIGPVGVMAGGAGDPPLGVNMLFCIRGHRKFIRRGNTGRMMHTEGIGGMAVGTDVCHLFL